MQREFTSDAGLFLVKKYYKQPKLWKFRYNLYKYHNKRMRMALAARTNRSLISLCSAFCSIYAGGLSLFAHILKTAVVFRPIAEEIRDSVSLEPWISSFWLFYSPIALRISYSIALFPASPVCKGSHPSPLFQRASGLCIFCRFHIGHCIRYCFQQGVLRFWRYHNRDFRF